MPKVDSKSDAKTIEQSPTLNGILSRVGPIKATNLGRLKLSLYGDAGTGKTRLACSFPKPLLLIGGEDGTASVVGTPGVSFVPLEVGDVCKDCNAIVGALSNGTLKQGGKPFATVVLDTASSLRDIRISEILGWDMVPNQKGFGFASMDQWSECAQNLKDLIKPLLDLTKMHPINVIIVAHEQVFTPSDKKLAMGAEHCQIHTGSALGESLCKWLNKEVDYIAQTLIRDQVIRTKQTIDGIETETAAATGRKEYTLRVGPHSVYYSKFRLPNGRVLAEDFITDPTYDKIASLIAGK